MFRLNYLIPLAGVLVLASCSDATAPLTQDAADVPELFAAKGGKGGGGKDRGTAGSGDPAGFVLRQSPTAPALEVYQLSFWAVQGRGTTARVYYDVPSAVPHHGSENRFLQFEVPRSGLEAYPDGTPIATGDSVLITLTIDPVTFDVQFAPSGLQFDRRKPAQLEIWYGNADPDLDRDGDVDPDDDAARELLSYFYHDSGSTDWKKTKSDHSDGTETISTAVPHFSGFAVSW